MQTVIRTLVSVLLVLELAKTTPRMFDGDNTGADDKLADGLQRIIDEINIFVSTHQTEPSTVARGYAATLRFCNNVIASLDLLIESGLPKTEKLAQASALVASLTDDTKVYPAKKGADATVLAETKTKAAERLKTIRES